MIRIVRGNPTPEELAAALVVVQARAAAASAIPATPQHLHGWTAKTRTISCDASLQPGPAAWRSSYWPR
ncbi:acyl-CoA carboxylase epsilon subunit [Streptomyces rugosispiralis]|uniref:Acyl-CoA carboxylase subunit epsilon n=1 Tax=Streptomyces rugosispiralis TaxID=2967341 RepID=A0ABT1VDZ5_9ACTN|nr:acyl-CoA carboxylase epsilon subunit [Streptomyces rugosispiralis]MCQ8195623.1 acyl-CoA carboxylase subunit epsilon [Streptomyces rugosispiralis]